MDDSESSSSDLDVPLQQIEESSAQKLQDAQQFLLIARILTGRTEFVEKADSILEPGSKDACDTDNSALGTLLSMLSKGQYSKTAEGALEDIVVPIRYAVRCSGEKKRSGFAALFTLRRDHPERYINTISIIELLSFHYAALTYIPNLVTINMLTRFEQSVLSGRRARDMINIFPEQLQKVIRGGLSIPYDQLNAGRIKTYFGGSVPFLLIFRKDALHRAMEIGSQDANVVSQQGGGVSMTAYGSETTENISMDSNGKPLRPIFLTEGSIGDLAKAYEDVTSLKNSSGRVLGDDSGSEES